MSNNNNNNNNNIRLSSLTCVPIFVVNHRPLFIEQSYPKSYFSDSHVLFCIANIHMYLCLLFSVKLGENLFYNYTWYLKMEDLTLLGFVLCPLIFK